MVREGKGPLKVFLCHASGDKPPVRDLYKRLTVEGIDAWLDKEKLLPGQDWRLEIPRAVRDADVVVVCLSNRSITKEGYVQKEIRFALDIAEEKPEGTIFLIPARLEECTVPERLNRWQWVDLYEDDGFIKLLRSLKLRADAVGATVEPDLYVDSAKETDLRLEQLYTEGLAAFYTEDWDRACRCFQSILSERPNHKNAAEKLEEAERQRQLSKLYEQATGAVRSEDWGTVIQILEELSTKSADYKDTAHLLRDARKQKQLRDLYAEAKALHAGKQWEAVVKVFEQISSIEPNYPDVDGLLPSAQKEVAELKRLAELNEQYSHALREMDAGNWFEARRLLEWVHKSETGFLETEKLLKKVENEILKEEERRKQNDQINTLYEQAHGLLRSKKWRNALDKMGEIRKLDEHFSDTDGIIGKAQKELVREVQEAEQQNKLAALYVEAVKLLKEEKYQDALDKWGEVRAIDPKYPDRQAVGRTAKKALAKQAKPISAKPRFVMPKFIWIGLGSILVITVLFFAINQFGDGENKASLAPTVVPTNALVEKNVLPASTTTSMPSITDIPRPATSIPTTGVYSDPTMYDDFADTQYDGSYNQAKWSFWRNTGGGGQFVQKNGLFVINTGQNYSVDINLSKYKSYLVSKPMFIEAKIMLDPAKSTMGFHLGVEGVNEFSSCGVTSNKTSEMQTFECGNHYSSGYESVIRFSNIESSWHLVRIEIYPDTQKVEYYVDGQRKGPYKLPGSTTPNQARFRFVLGMWKDSSDTSSPVGYIDYVRMGAIEDDPTVYDNFNDTSFDGKFDTTKWEYKHHDIDGSIYQEDGNLVFNQNGTKDRWQFLKSTSIDSYPNSSAFFESSLKLDPDNKGGDIQLHFENKYGKAACGVSGPDSSAYCWCNSGDSQVFNEGMSVESSSWHFFRIEIIQPELKFTFYIDGNDIGSCTLPDPTGLLDSKADFAVGGWLRSESVLGYIDEVRIGPLK